MDTHLTPTPAEVVRYREDALRAPGARAHATFRARISDADTIDSARATLTGAARVSQEEAQPVAVDTADRAGRRRGGGLDLLVVTLFAVLAAGFVSLVVTTLQVG